jgi:hypothetical protein
MIGARNGPMFLRPTISLALLAKAKETFPQMPSE